MKKIKRLFLKESGFQEPIMLSTELNAIDISSELKTVLTENGIAGETAEDVIKALVERSNSSSSTISNFTEEEKTFVYTSLENVVKKEKAANTLGSSDRYSEITLTEEEQNDINADVEKLTNSDATEKTRFLTLFNLLCEIIITSVLKGGTSATNANDARINLGATKIVASATEPKEMNPGDIWVRVTEDEPNIEEEVQTLIVTGNPSFSNSSLTQTINVTTDADATVDLSDISLTLDRGIYKFIFNRDNSIEGNLGITIDADQSSLSVGTYIATLTVNNPGILLTSNTVSFNIEVTERIPSSQILP